MCRFALPIFLCTAWLCTGAVPGPASQQSARSPLANTVILIIRHAEKPEEGSGLTPEGERRARAYVGYFKNYLVEGKPLIINHIFAAADSEGSRRPRLTVEPLSAAIHMKIDLRFSDKDPAGIANDVATHHYGREILICWRHGKIPALVKALGADPQMFVPEGKWPGKIFDRAIELHFDARGKIDPGESRLVREHLMPGDEK